MRSFTIIAILFCANIFCIRSTTLIVKAEKIKFAEPNIKETQLEKMEQVETCSSFSDQKEMIHIKAMNELFRKEAKQSKFKKVTTKYSAGCALIEYTKELE